MIYPTANDVLRCIDQTLAESADADLPAMARKSALASCRHLVRHVELRLRLERGLLQEDAERLAALLPGVADYLADSGSEGPAQATAIRQQLSRPAPASDDGSDDLEPLRAHVLALREALYQALALLQKLDASRRESATYQALREGIRGYIREELQQEDLLIHDAFVGQGPRR